jgi:uncharacterized membrane protein
MAPGDQQDEYDQKQSNQQTQAAIDLAALASRVEALERQLAELRASSPRRFPQLHPARKTTASAIDNHGPNFAKHLPKIEGSLENRIGSQLFSRIGIVALLVATTLFLKWAIDNHYIGPIGRILAGLIAGTGVILWSERFRRQNFNAFSYALKAIGSGALYLSLWAAFQLYHLLPAEVALGAMILVTAWNAYMAWAQNSQILAAYALAGGFATPLLLSSGGNHEVFLFSYILAIDIATVVLVRLKPWQRLLLGAFPATVAFFIAWYVDWYGAYQTPRPVLVTAIFVVLFFIAFIIPSLRKSQKIEQHTTLGQVLLPLANAIFVALALYSLLQDAGHHDLLPWIAILLAASYLGLMRLPQTRVTSAVHLSLAVVFLTIAIPLKASGRWITVGWLAEGVALLWVSARLYSPAPGETDVNLHRVIRRLAVAALALGFFGLIIQPFWLYDRIDTAFLNSRFATSIFGIAALAASIAIALHARHQQDSATPTWLQIAGSSTIALNLIALLACVRELDTTWRYTLDNPEANLQRSLAVSAFLMLYGAGLLAIGFWKRSAFIRWQALILLVFTIAKAFLYDLRDLSQGYRVLSFLGLGALLMAVSFAYQKDWLALRDPHPAEEPGNPSHRDPSHPDPRHPDPRHQGADQ